MASEKSEYPKDEMWLLSRKGWACRRDWHRDTQFIDFTVSSSCTTSSASNDSICIDMIARIDLVS